MRKLTKEGEDHHQCGVFYRDDKFTANTIYGVAEGLLDVVCIAYREKVYCITLALHHQ